MIDNHLEQLSQLNWSRFEAASYDRPALKAVRSEINTLVQLFQRHKDHSDKYLLRNVNKKSGTGSPTPVRRDVVAAFKRCLSTVSIVDKEFHTASDASRKKSSKNKGECLVLPPVCQEEEGL